MAQRRAQASLGFLMIRSAAAAVLLALLPTPRAGAQAPGAAVPLRPHPEFLVQTSWLASRLGSSRVVVLHVGHTDEMYRAGHIPGALFVPLSAVAIEVNGVPNEFPPAAQLAATFRDLGVGNAARIVIYGDDPGLLAARVWVALDLLGQSAGAAILDGGLVRWKAEHRPVETPVRSPHPLLFASRWQAERVVSAAWVRAHLGDPSVVLVDARPPEQYAGAAGDPTSGHVPGAKSVYWMTALVSAADPVLRPAQALREALWRPTGADRRPARTVVTYCQTGMQASYDFFVARYLGYPDVRLYDGSMSEWTMLNGPVERKAQ